MRFEGPIGRLRYMGYGKIRIQQTLDKYGEHKYKQINMIAGGTGITPML